MNLIKRIEIKHFRSINELVIGDLSHINVFSGLNDVGKSNVIKALNLFFNNQVDWQSNLNFDRDINSWHDHIAPHGHNKKYISVRIEFNRPKDRFRSVRNPSFWIRREWDKDNPVQPLPPTWGKDWHSKHEIKWNRGLTWFLKQCKFLYVPAVRDRNYLQHLLAEFSKSITDAPDPELKAESERLSNMIETRSSNLRRNLKRVTGIDVSLELPQTMLALLEASGLNTEGDIPLQFRGDGIQSLTVTGILADLTSQRSKNFYFWGFEEPENSLEYIKAAHLADEIRDHYSKNVQVFVSTHSPAFVAMKNERTSIYRIGSVRNVCNKDHIVPFESKTSSLQQIFGSTLFDEVAELSEDLGILDVMKGIDEGYREHERIKDELRELKNKRHNDTAPLLIVEGPNDCKTLRHAWSRLCLQDLPFQILAAGGVDEVTRLLRIHGSIKGLIFALFDHDERGTNKIKELNKYGFTRTNDEEDCCYTLGSVVTARTLPAPPGRESNSQNLNLTLEHFFSDTVLSDINVRSGNKLFSKKHYVKDGTTYFVDEETLQGMIDNGTISLVHRKLDSTKGRKRSGKNYLVEYLPSIRDSEFEAFHALFKMILDHLMPGFLMTRKEASQD